ncbi:NFACT RNA binding domain-containing protein [soil metagenome]
MSNTIRYDSLLVRALAAELNRDWSGRRLDAAYLERDTLHVTLRTRPRRRGDEAPSLLWQLHPLAGHLTRARAEPDSGQVQLGAPARILQVSAPPDERVLQFVLDTGAAPAGHAHRIIIELITNQWNAVAVGADGRIVAVLRERQTKDRTLRAGIPYALPRSFGRQGADAPMPLHLWTATLAAAAPGERIAALLRTVAYTSPINAQWILGDADVHDGDAALARAHERYLQLVWPDADPRDGTGLMHRASLLRVDGAAQPYPAPVAGDAAPVDSLLAAFEQAAIAADATPAEPDAFEKALALIARRIETLERRTDRLRDELGGAAEAAEHLRREADLLLAQLHRVQRGAATVELDDFEGGTVTIELDPAIGASDNATRRYDTARRRDRAAARIPALIENAARELGRLESLAARVRDGSASVDELADLRARQERSSRPADGPALPYREYRTTGGLEVRVGRGSRSNDDLTFRHSSPTDIWLHARDVAGAHVILRWPHTAANPPAADIAEAAILAALSSRARTSGLVAVDWTRRKHVRKPRKAAPGLVIPERVKTVFVEPNESVEEKMRVEGM